MKKFYTLLLVIISVAVNAQNNYDKWFSDNTLRMDYEIWGTRTKAEAKFEAFTVSNRWGGERFAVNDCPKYGGYYMQLTDYATDSVIYTYSYSSLFEEWQMMDSADYFHKPFREAVIMPMPKQKSVVTIYKGVKGENFEKLFAKEIDPKTEDIKQAPMFPVTPINNPKEENGKIGIAILSYGYPNNKKQDFINEAKKATNWLLESEPFSEFKDRLEINAVFVESHNAPRGDINTHLSFYFNTFGIERYLASLDIPSVYNCAQSTAFRHVIVLVNSEVYGGSGFYNFYACVTSQNKYSKEVLLHEFGHSFAGLGDEYEGGVTYDTTEINKQNKYPNLATADKIEAKWGKIDAVEGGGYCSKGVFRPYEHCRMHALNDRFYCPCCKKIVRETIIRQTEPQK